ncbi:hypothetical protein SAMN02745157_1478 [Kaistia soli DSM 19436]|uniref:Uncharacterized protein n=1 Tax=Kaistia soli DSM 19436 TaxID=1122133 RepID=A0A1M4YBR1_9HYPH|nr:hypothetical protein [Kaistia soli]SHF03180.1 hypothetical protein SAMN02745157_1478 [Kaistia soli DSM 19436]
MQLVSDWRALLKHAWTVRFFALAAICAGATQALPALIDVIPPWPYAALMFIAQAGSIVFPVLGIPARVVAQPKTLGGDDAGQ